MKDKKDNRAKNKITAKVGVVPLPARQITIKPSPFDTFIKNHPLLVFTVTELLLILVIFHKYLFLERVYFFRDTDCDSINEYWSYYVHYSEYFRSTGFPRWSFNWGIGKNVFQWVIGNPFTLMVCLFPKDILPYSVVFVEALKIFLAGLVFFFYIRLIKMTAFTAIVGGLLYSLSGFMITGSTVGFLSVEALYAAFTLYCIERFLRHGAWYLVPIPFFLFASFQCFVLYLYGGLAVTYSIVRILLFEGWQLKKMFLTVCKVGALAFLGVIVSSFIFLSNLDLMIHNPRSYGGEGASVNTMLSIPVFLLSSPHELTTSLYRLFSNDVLGMPASYHGLFHWFEDPAIHTSILVCMLFPLSFFFMKTRKRIIYIILTIICLIPTFYPFFRHLFWIFSGDYYRTYSLFVVMLLLFLCLKTLSALDSNVNLTVKGKKEKIIIPVLILTFAAWIILLYYPYVTVVKYEHPMVDNDLRIIITIFLAIFTLFLCLYIIPRYKAIIVPILCATLLVELTYFNSYSVNYRHTVTWEDLHQKTGFNDYTNEAVDLINSKDHGFFRISKDYSSAPVRWDAGYNEGMIQNYKSTSSYESFSELYYCHFLNEMNVWTKEGVNYRKICPCRTRPLLSIILNEKYVFTKHLAFTKVPFNFDSVSTAGNVTITKYKANLPFGYSYTKYITLAEFRKLSKMQKDRMLIRAAVIMDDDLPNVKDMTQMYSTDTLTLKGQANFFELAPYLDSLREDSLTYTSYTNNNIKGTINPQQTKLLFFSIPWDKGWEMKVDGTPVKTLMPNISFIGVVLNKGKHTIELNYFPPYLKPGMVISGFGLLGYLFLFIRFRKKRV